MSSAATRRSASKAEPGRLPGPPGRTRGTDASAAADSPGPLTLASSRGVATVMLGLALGLLAGAAVAWSLRMRPWQLPDALAIFRYAPQQAHQGRPQGASQGARPGAPPEASQGAQQGVSQAPQGASQEDFPRPHTGAHQGTHLDAAQEHLDAAQEHLDLPQPEPLGRMSAPGPERRGELASPAPPSPAAAGRGVAAAPAANEGEPSVDATRAATGEAGPADNWPGAAAANGPHAPCAAAPGQPVTASQAPCEPAGVAAGPAWPGWAQGSGSGDAGTAPLPPAFAPASNPSVAAEAVPRQAARQAARRPAPPLALPVPEPETTAALPDILTGGAVPAKHPMRGLSQNPLPPPLTPTLPPSFRPPPAEAPRAPAQPIVPPAAGYGYVVVPAGDAASVVRVIVPAPRSSR